MKGEALKLHAVGHFCSRKSLPGIPKVWVPGGKGRVPSCQFHSPNGRSQQGKRLVAHGMRMRLGAHGFSTCHFWSWPTNRTQCVWLSRRWTRHPMYIIEVCHRVSNRTSYLFCQFPATGFLHHVASFEFEGIYEVFLLNVRLLGHPRTTSCQNGSPAKEPSFVARTLFQEAIRAASILRDLERNTRG